MKLWRNARHELTREGLVRLFPALRAECEIIVDRSLEGCFQFGDALSLEGDHVARVEDFAMENPRFVVEFDFANITLVFHHGVTPAWTRNRRMERTAPLSVSFCGCGR